MLLGAGSYVAGAAIGGDSRRWQTGVSIAVTVAGVKEFYGDLYNGKDTKRMAAIHFLTILAGAGAVAGAWH